MRPNPKERVGEGEGAFGKPVRKEERIKGGRSLGAQEVKNGVLPGQAAPEESTSNETQAPREKALKQSRGGQKRGGGDNPCTRESRGRLGLLSIRGKAGEGENKQTKGI